LLSKIYIFFRPFAKPEIDFSTAQTQFSLHFNVIFMPKICKKIARFQKAISQKLEDKIWIFW